MAGRRFYKTEEVAEEFEQERAKFLMNTVYNTEKERVFYNTATLALLLARRVDAKIDIHYKMKVGIIEFLFEHFGADESIYPQDCIDLKTVIERANAFGFLTQKQGIRPSLFYLMVEE